MSFRHCLGRCVRHRVWLLILVLVGNGAIELIGQAQNRPAVDHHRIEISLTPGQHRLQANLKIHFGDLDPQKKHELDFFLHSDLKIQVNGGTVKLELLGKSGSLVNRYRLTLEVGEAEAHLSYSGVINDDLSDGDSSGLISGQGVVLFTSTYWTPIFVGRQLTFALEVALPLVDWEVISQGILTDEKVIGSTKMTHWIERLPQEDLYLIAGPFKKYVKMHNGIEAAVYLRQPDAQMANNYLDITHQYIEDFSQALGPYPYLKFAAIENLWETGFGMPSFTLLGPTVMRLPFILYSSYPHEVLHNWWGNSVYVDYASGNWCEGLTTYMADHALQVARGQGANYRRTVLQNYRTFVREAAEFPLREFTGRHSIASQAIGYGKTMMFFHALKTQLGEVLFDRAIKQFYQEQIYQKSSYADFLRVFNQVSQLDLTAIFSQWIDRIGSPELVLQEASLVTNNSSRRQEIHLTLQQSQTAAEYELFIPVVVVDKNGSELGRQVLPLKQRQETFVWEAPAGTHRIRVDPEFDVFRRVNEKELPAAFSGLFGEEQKTYFILPRASDLAIFYEQWAQQVAREQEGTTAILWDNEVSKLPGDGSIWILGAENVWVMDVAAKARELNVRLGSSEVSFAGQNYTLAENSVALVFSHEAHVMGFLAAPEESILMRMGVKLPHYGKYGGLVFKGETNIYKEQWPVLHSPLEFVF